MSRYRTAEEVRRYDMMKLGVLILLLVLLLLTWFATRDNGGLDLTDEAQPTAVAEEDLGREPGPMPEPTLAMPAIDIPVGSLTPGAVTLSGRAGPGAQVALLADGVPLGMASAGVDGYWALTTDLPAGQHTVIAQTLDNVGGVVAESPPLTITVGAAPTAGVDGAAGEAWATTATFNSLVDSWTLGGVAAPNAAVVVLSGGVPLAEATADTSGAWAVDVPAAGLGSEVVVQTTDAAGVMTSSPVTIGPRPPGIATPGQISSLPDGGTFLAVPVGIVVWTGQGTAGQQVEAVVDGQNAGLATVDPNGNWTLSLDLPPGAHTVQFNARDAAGALLAAGQGWAVAAGEQAATDMAAGSLVAPTVAAEASPPAEGVATPGAESTTGAATPGAEDTAGAVTPGAESTAGADTTPAAGGTPAATGDSLLATLQGRPEFATLLSALSAAGLDETLAGPGTFTVFAPTNAAFAALPQPVVDALLANPDVLAELLQYHVARGRYTAGELRTVQPSTVNGRLLTITAQGDDLSVNGATVLEADVAAGNGLIHAIDRILLPPLTQGVRPPVIDESGVAIFVGPALTVVGTAEPGRTLYVEIDGEAFGQPATVDANGFWQVSGEVAAGEQRIVAFMVNGETLEAFSRPVTLVAR